MARPGTKATHPASRGGLLASLRMDEQFESIHLCVVVIKILHILLISHMYVHTQFSSHVFSFTIIFHNDQMNGLLFIWKQFRVFIVL